MIQFNKTIFQFAKRLALMVIGMFITATAWGFSDLVTKPTDPKITITARTNVDAGSVYIEQTALGATSGEPSASESLVINSTTSGVRDDLLCDHEWYEHGSSCSYGWYRLLQDVIVDNTSYGEPDPTVSVKIVATDITSSGYVFGGWFGIATDDDGNEIATQLNDAEGNPWMALEYTFTLDINNPTYTIYEARWLKPDVTGVEGANTFDFGTYNSTEQIQDIENNINPNAVLNHTAQFTIHEYVNVTNFVQSTSTNLGNLVDSEYQLESSKGFQLAGGNAATDPDANGNGVYSLPVKYVPTGIHGSITGRAILKSRVYSEAVTGEPDLSKYEWRYVNLTVQEDYRPDFTAKNNSNDEDKRYDLKEVALGGSVTSDAAIYPTLNNPAAKAPLGNTKGTTQWIYTITEVTDDNGKTYSSSEIKDMFTITHTVGGEPIVTFIPGTDPTRFGFPNDGGIHTRKLFATMTIQCTYMDAVPKTVQSIEGKHTTYIKVTVKQENEAILRFNDTKISYESEEAEESGTGGTYDFRTIIIGDNSKTIDLSIYAANVNFAEGACTVTGTDNSLFEVNNPLDGKVTISIPNSVTCCGNKSATLTITGTSTLDNTTKKIAEVNLTATLELAKPQVHGFGTNQTVTFTWEEVPGADSYEVFTSTDGTNWTPANDYEYNPDKPELSYSMNTGSNGETRWCKVVATQSCGTSCRSESDPISAISAMDKIDKENKAATGIYTGTQGTVPGNGRGVGSTYRQVDVSDAFNGDNPICDRLYIFGETTGNVTPLYVFVKDEGNKCYRLVYTEGKYNTENNVNATRTSYLTINLNTEGALVKEDDTKYYDVPLKDIEEPSLYFTGYCPYASTTGNGTHGVIHIIGGSKTVNLYLEDLQIYASNNTNSVTLGVSDLSTIQTNGYYYDTPGSGAVFALEPTTTNADQPFTVKMHVQDGTKEGVRGVVLDAAKGATIVIDMKQKVGLDTETLLADNPSHYSSPIQVLIKGGASGESRVAKLVVDDEWNGEHTNATLNLQENTTDDSNASNISIDLGNAKTQLEINGANIKMQGIAAAYTQVSYPATDNTSWIARGLTTTSTVTDITKTIGVGKSVLITNGTFTGSATGEDAELKWYFPALTIDGGSYNTPIGLYTADNANASDNTQIKNTDGKALGRATVNCANGDYGTISGGLFTVSNFDKMVDDLFPDFGFNDAKAGDNYHRPLSAYYPYTINDKPYNYGTDNLFVDGEDKIYLMLPRIDCEGKTTPWQVCGPELVMKYDNQNANLGGGVVKLAGCVNHPEKSYKVEKLLYAEIDEYTRGALGGGFFNLQQSNITISLDEKKELYSTIDNSSAYNIQKKVYMLKPIVAAQWMLFAAPFDVQNVYVIEAYPEKQLVKDFNGVRGYIRGEENIANARKAQSRRLVELYALWYSQVIKAGVPVDFYFTPKTITSEDENGVTTTQTTYGPVIDTWMTIESSVGKDGAMNTTDEDKEKYKPIIERLQHYIEATDAEGNVTNNLNDANYYLYESGDNWKYTEGGNFTTTWKIASNDKGLVMEQGHVYAMQFPYNLIGGTHNPATDWDYWTGKYILLESTDLSESTEVHTINGTGDVKYGEASPGSAILSGNASFGESTPTSLNGNMWTVKKEANTIQHKTEEITGSLAPTEGFLLANFNPPANMRALSIDYRTGEVEYEKIDDVDPGLNSGVPTIMGDLSLMVVPTAEGLTITPLKEQHVMLFDAEGKMIFSKYMSEEESVSLPTGVYVVRGEYEQVKAIKK